MTDVRIIDQGTLIGLKPVTEAATAWFADNVESSDWQWMHDTLWVDQRYVRDLLDGIVNAGLTLEVK